MAISLKEHEEGRVIDLDGPMGNAFVLLGIAADWCRQLEWDTDTVTGEMRAGDYAHLLAVFDSHFGTLVELQSSNQQLLDDVASAKDMLYNHD